MSPLPAPAPSETTSSWWQSLNPLRAWERTPPFVRDTLLSIVPVVGDGLDLIQQGWNAARGKGIDPVIVTLSTVGIAADLGWLDGVVPDPADAVNAGAALLKAAYRQMSGPAKEAFERLLEGAARNGDQLKEMLTRTAQLLPYAQTLARHPNAVARLLNFPEVAFQRALTSPSEFAEAIRRAEFADRFIGKRVSDLSAAERRELQQAYTLAKDGVIRRQSIDDGYTQLQIDNDGVIREASGQVSDRISNPARMRNNYERSYGKLAEGHQIHHLIPDAVIR